MTDQVLEHSDAAIRFYPADEIAPDADDIFDGWVNSQK